MIQELIRTLINGRTDKPCIVIPGYSGKKEPPKPFATMYLVTSKEPDVYDSDVEEKSDDSVKETTKYWGEFTFQFDILGNTDDEAKTKAQDLKNLIAYKMRYSDWQPINIGIVNSEFSLKNLNEQNGNEWIYRRSLDITFESELTLERVTELAKTIEVTANGITFTIKK